MIFRLDNICQTDCSVFIIRANEKLYFSRKIPAEWIAECVSTVYVYDWMYFESKKSSCIIITLGIFRIHFQTRNMMKWKMFFFLFVVFVILFFSLLVLRSSHRAKTIGTTFESISTRVIQVTRIFQWSEVGRLKSVFNNFSFYLSFGCYGRWLVSRSVYIYN